jgi:hypothetical protein
MGLFLDAVSENRSSYLLFTGLIIAVFFCSLGVQKNDSCFFWENEAFRPSNFTNKFLLGEPAYEKQDVIGELTREGLVPFIPGRDGLNCWRGVAFSLI